MDVTLFNLINQAHTPWLDTLLLFMSEVGRRGFVWFVIAAIASLWPRHRAAAWRLPFLPTRVGLGSDLHLVNPDLRTFRSPYPGPDGGEGEELIAQPAIHLDAAICHLNVGDERGNAAFTGPDLYFDDLMLEAAEQRFTSVERTVPVGELVDAAGDLTRLRISRLFVDARVLSIFEGSDEVLCLKVIARRISSD